MAKRVSLKGRGADIFFGDYTPPSDPTVPAPEAAPAEAGGLATEAVAEGSVSPGAAEPERPDAEASEQAGGRQRSSTQTKQASKRTSLQASKQENMHASLQKKQDTNTPGQSPSDLQASKLASLQASTRTGQRVQEMVHQDLASDADAGDGFAPELGELGDEIWVRVDAAATITSSFRYTESELTALTDVLYEVGKQYGARVTKQDVARLALNAVLNDYYQRGPGSLLGKLAARRRRHAGGR